MHWGAFFTTFAAVFLAEIGDKTQLAVFGFASQDVSKWTVFIAASLGLIAATSIGVLAGAIVGKYIDPTYIKYGSGVLFIVIGLVIMLKQ
jgi:putative Ca2+/H+ antiporter (TMEM165/GDT1 family)